MHKQFGNLILAVGILLLTAALFLVSHNMAEENRAEAAVGEVMPALSEAIAAQLTSAPPAATDDVPEPGEVPDVEEIILIDGEAFIGYLTIDALSLSLPVRQVLTERNLKQSPCRYAGCAGTRGFVIAAHNYRRHFADLASLAAGDTVRFTDVSGAVYTYTVAQTETLDAADVAGMTDDSWDLTLFTCTYSGERRITVRCTAAQIKSSPLGEGVNEVDG